MSSILSGYFRESLDRIYSRADILDRRQPEIPPQPDFSKVLETLQKGLKNEAQTGDGADLSERHVMSPVVTATEAVLSNLSLSEGGSIGTVASITPARFVPPDTQNAETVKPPTMSVNPPTQIETPKPVVRAKIEVTPEVKITPPAPPVPVLRTVAPATPQIVSAKIKARVVEQVAIAPATPVIKSAQLLKNTDFGQELAIKTTSFKTQEVREIITAAGRHHGVDPRLSLAVASAESGLRPNVVSNDGHRSKGIFQLLDSTGLEMLDRLGVEDRYDPFNPALNAYLGVGYLRHLHDLFSTETTLTGSLKTNPAKSSEQLEKLAVAAYNSGQGTVARAQEKARRAGRDPAEYNSIAEFLPASTRSYVARVTQLKKAFDDVA